MSKILLVGDFMTDCTADVSELRQSQEAPIQILSNPNFTSLPGGAGNVAMNLLALIPDVELICFGIVGHIPLPTPGAKQHFIYCEDRLTTTKTRYFHKNKQVVRIDEETTNYISDEVVEELKGMIFESLSEADAIIFSDYDKGVCTPELVKSIIDEVYRIEMIEADHIMIPIFVDPKFRDVDKYKGATLIKFNQGEWLEADGELVWESAIDYRVVTNGYKGLSFIDHIKNTTHWEAPHKVPVYDVTGAGDTVISIIVASWLKGYNPLLCCKFANFGASLVVQKKGTGSVTWNDLEEYIKETGNENVIEASNIYGS